MASQRRGLFYDSIESVAQSDSRSRLHFGALGSPTLVLLAANLDEGGLIDSI